MDRRQFGIEYDRAPVHPGVDGINVAGYLRNRTGIGTVARRYVEALQSSEIPFALKDLSSLNPIGSEDPGLTEFDTEHPYSTNLVCVNAVEYPVFAWHVGEQFLRDRYNIGVWFWELRTFPDEWLDRFEHYAELWAPTSFIASTLAPVSPVPVVPVPVVLTTPRTGSRERGRQRLGVTDDEFVYLYIFDFRSYFERKNPLALVDAFRLAFAPHMKARLVIKCVNDDFDPAAFAELSERARGYAVDILTGYWSAAEMHDLMAACDAFASLHRSEGLGLTIAEAMACGKPVIATDWSGNTDYMDIANSFPVRYQLVELDHDVGPYRAGNVWADPSVEHAAELLQFLYDNRETAAQRGQVAQRSMSTNYSAQRVAEIIAARLEVIGNRRGASAPAVTPAVQEESVTPTVREAPVVPPMELETSIYGWPGRVAKRGVSFLLSYHTLFQHQINVNFANFLRELEIARDIHARRLDDHAAQLDQLRQTLRDARLELEEAIRQQTVSEGQRVYLPFFKGATDVVVIGAGSGEFLRLLIEHGVRAVGVEPDDTLARRALARGLPMAHADPSVYLSERAACSLDGVFSAHTVGHLAADVLNELLAATHARLRPGGVCILQTAEPEPDVLLQTCYRVGFSSGRILYNTVTDYALVAVA
jgi:glycosyltransferase involved in cell wall biosynthesis/SAM-dependent methyltransferase